LGLIANIFYYTSFEFVDYLVSNHGEDFIQDVLRAVKEGNTFETAVQDETGNSLQKIYGDWETRFF